MMMSKGTKARTGLSGANGFTFIEIMVVLALLGLFGALAVGYIFPSDAEKLETAGLRLASAIRYAFDESVVQGQYYRLQFNLSAEEGSSYQLESREEPFYLSPAEQQEEKTQDLESEEESSAVEFSAVDEGLFKREKFPDGIKVQDVWLSYLEEPLKEGSAGLYFLPNAWVEPAVIHLSTEDEEKVLRLEINPATGRSKISHGYEEAHFKKEGA